jgi:phospholipid/cholesterol/gamma-HCH transport system substrate-binding protein
VNKQAPSAGRIVVMAGFALSCFGLLLYLWLAFGGPIPLKPKGYRMDVSFPEAQQLAEQADVRISGVPIGKVQDTVANKNTGTTVATLEIEEKYAPVPKDTRAVLRQKTLLGETYVELTPGNASAGMVPEGGALPVGAVSPTVEVDELFRTFNPQQRRDFQIWMQQLALASKDRGRDISEAIGNLAPFAEETRDLAKILNAQAPALQSVVRDTGEVFEALTEREGQLRGLVESSDRVFAATGRRAQDLREAFTALPTFERESRVTVQRLTRFADDTRPLVNQLRPFARELSPTLQDLNGLAPDLRNLFQDLDPAISASEKGLPAIDSVATELRKTLPELTPLFKQLSPNVEGFGRYLPEIGSFFANAAAATNAYDVDDQGRRLHYLRVVNPVVPENLATYQRRIGSNRTLPYIFASLFGGAYAKFEQGLDSFETRHCGRPHPILAPESVDANPIDPAYEALIPRRVAQDVKTLAFGDTPRQVPAPACNAQVLFPTYGVPAPGTKYPQLRENRRLLGTATFSPRPPDAEPPAELTEGTTATR